jgi:hypothetical protein
MRRLFWLGVGVAAGVALSRKATRVARQATPAGIAANLGDAMRELATAVGTFGADIRAGMAEREEELSDMVEQRSGVSPMARRALGARGDRRAAVPQPRVHDARARRANG